MHYLKKIDSTYKFSSSLFKDLLKVVPILLILSEPIVYLAFAFLVITIFIHQKLYD